MNKEEIPDNTTEWTKYYIKDDVYTQGFYRGVEMMCLIFIPVILLLIIIK